MSMSRPCFMLTSNPCSLRKSAIIGADFLREHGLLVNMKQGRLIDMMTNLLTQGTISKSAGYL